MTNSLRFIAAQIISRVLDGESLADTLPALSFSDPRDRAFVQMICYGVCRFYTRLDYLLSQLLTKPMKAKDSDVYALLLVGLYQLMETRVPAHAAVAETVAATTEFKKPWARGLVNAVLRQYLRRETELKKLMMEDEEACYAHPAWWIKSIKAAWPKQWQGILSANNEHPPFSLRVSQQHHPREAYLNMLSQAGYSAKIISSTAMGLMLDTPLSVELLPGFSQGDVFVQDGAAQFAAPLLDLAPQQRVLDACAAPGGKLLHILDIMPTLSKVVAVDKEIARCEMIKQNLARFAMPDQSLVEVICADVSETKKWWDQPLFDRILLDAPCSASGVIRRHPDIKLLRQVTDIAPLAKEQLHLLRALWPLLKPGGLLLYATCSIFPEENTQVVNAFLQSEPSANEEKITATWGIACETGRQILPGDDEMDGFYYARLRKSTNPV